MRQLMLMMVGLYLKCVVTMLSQSSTMGGPPIDSGPPIDNLLVHDQFFVKSLHFFF